MKELRIYTDGACKGNPGPGGWGAVLMWGDHIKKVAGFESNTTNNRMELIAAIEGLKQIKNKDLEIHLYTDSQYLKKGMTEWINMWLKNNWNNNKVKNQDLWLELNQLSKNLNIKWHWVKGHNGDYGNEMADELARDQIEERYKNGAL